ncbi:MAG TPA: bifunctional adenosylcobinamide kinase/adenosylcobinamide-phosphate guanylyltransferase [Acidimicrobiales bacterium]|jgi:adenosyl cobinamide kinase/adenosyl cobinamide phosphate guanylyltransferase|nr:bifunctional adenosylcobinamide kinase/adenosylcobinamide-phosphate guanylyltransferase [Acidimicrobiales bacterium]
MITLVLGGARSGKSMIAERLAGRHAAPVTYVATMAVGDDTDLGVRVAAHQARRPAQWTTIEAGDGLIRTLRRLTGTALVDSLASWLAAQPDMIVDAQALCSVLLDRRGDTVIVSDEVGLSVHPSSASGRLFRDALGSLNQAVASVADATLLVVAGRVLSLGPLEDC